MRLLRPAGKLAPVSPFARVSAFYFWLMGTAGLATPYLALWLSSRGLDEREIGLVNSAPLLALMAFGLLAGSAADLRFSWRTVIVAGAGLAAVTPLTLLFAEGYWLHALCWVLILAPVNITIPITDAASARLARRASRSYSRIRVWGTIGHMAATAGGGLVVGVYGIGAFLPLLVGVGVCRFLAALALPEMKRADVPPPVAPEDGALPLPPPATDPGPGGLNQFWRPWFLLPVLAGALIHASHFMQNAFGAIYWAEAGLSSGQIGLLWALAAGFEALMMLGFPHIARIASARTLLVAAGVVAALRWAGLATQPGFGWLMLLQALHMVSFGLTWLATVAFVTNWTEERTAARAQSLVSLLRQASAVAALIVFGALAEAYGAAAYLAAAVLALAAVAAAFASLLLMPPQRLDQVA